MTKAIATACQLVALSTSVLLAAGCAGMKSFAPPGMDLSRQRSQRREAIISEFESRRNQAQYEAAVARFQQGDLAGSEMLLVQLLDRNPQDGNARRMLADICLVQQDYDAAESHLQLLLTQDASDAQTHHALGLLLQVAGRSPEAIGYFKRAAELEPDNELYALSLPPNDSVPIANTSGQPVSELPAEKWVHVGD